MRIGTSSIVSTAMGASGDSMHDEKVIASNGILGDTGDVESISKSSLSRARRSIFGSYWQQNKNQNSQKVPAQQSRAIQRSKSPKCVLRHPHVQVYASPDQGIVYESQGDQGGRVSCSVTGDKDNSPLNEKEATSKQMSRTYESRPLPLSSIWKSLPAFFTDESSKVLVPRPIKSDTALDAKLLKSNLRKGRFSGESMSRDSRSKVANVTFQPMIKVHSFEPPMDRWAESGWSKLFDF